MDIHDDRLYSLSVPGHTKFDLSRHAQKVWVLPPNEALHDEARMTDLTSRLRESIAADEWGADYNDHPVVRRSVRPVLPLKLILRRGPVHKE